MAAAPMHSAILLNLPNINSPTKPGFTAAIQVSGTRMRKIILNAARDFSQKYWTRQGFLFQTHPLPRPACGRGGRSCCSLSRDTRMWDKRSGHAKKDALSAIGDLGS